MRCASSQKNRTQADKSMARRVRTKDAAIAQREKMTAETVGWSHHISDDTASYVLVHELPNEELRDVVSDLLTEEGRRYFFVLRTGLQVNIWKWTKRRETLRRCRGVTREKKGVPCGLFFLCIQRTTRTTSCTHEPTIMFRRL